MNISRICISRLYNTGNYEHKRYEIEVSLNESDNPELIKRAMEIYLDNQGVKITDIAIKRAMQKLESPDDYTGAEIKEAKEYLQKMESKNKSFYQILEDIQ